jgi:hypothetical protein
VLLLKVVNKRNVLTAVGIVLSFAVAMVGWVLTSRLIELNSERLLSMTLTIATKTLNVVPGNTATETPYSENGAYLFTRPTLTESEMVSILRNWSADGQLMPHEPSQEQITMEQAIELGREWLSIIDGLNIFSDEMLYFRNVRGAQLLQNTPHGQIAPLTPEYSYWALVFSNDILNVYMQMNAVTGQVWETDINIFRDDIGIDDLDVTNALSAFALALGISQDGHVVSESNEGMGVQIVVTEANVGATTRKSEVLTAYYAFAGGNIDAVVTATGWLLEDGERILRNMNLRLTD